MKSDIADSLEYIRLWESLKVVKREYKSIYNEFDLDSEISDTYYDFLDLAVNDQNWLEVIDWATTLAQNTRFDLLENNFSLNTMNTLMSNLLEVIEVARIKCSREWRK